MIFDSTKTKKDLNIISLGDIHLGNKRTTTLEVIHGLNKTFNSMENLSDIDIIFIEGDLFDTLLYNDDNDVRHIHLWQVKFCAMCKKNNIKLRILEGTPSHDMKQSTMFISVNEDYDIMADLKYIDKISVEVFDEWQASVVYIPDEANVMAIDTYHEAVQSIRDAGLENVDMACMHGAFNYQLPFGDDGHCHDIKLWSELVTGVIMIGHIHVPSHNGKVVAAGSFDRISHNEEHSKGMCHITLTNDDFQVKFIENKSAKTYKTINCKDLTTDGLLDTIMKVVDGVRPKSHLRLLGNESDKVALNGALSYMKSVRPDIFWSKKIELEDKKKQDSSDDKTTLTVKYTAVSITPSNILSLCATEMRDRNMGDAEIEQCLKVMEKLL